MAHQSPSRQLRRLPWVLAAGRGRCGRRRIPGIWPHTTRILPWLAAAFMLMLWLVPFDSITAPFSLGADSKLDRLALVVMFGAWALLSAAGGRQGPRFRSSPLNVAILIFLVAVFASLFTRLPILSNLDELVPSLKQLALLLSYFALFYFVATVLRAKEVPNFLNFMMILACLTAVGTLLEYRGHGTTSTTGPPTILKGFHVIPAARG